MSEIEVSQLRLKRGNDNYSRLKPIFARDRAVILQILNGKMRLAQRRKETFKGLLYAEIRKEFHLREGKFKELGSRIRELRAEGLIRTEQIPGSVKKRVFLT